MDGIMYTRTDDGHFYSPPAMSGDKYSLLTRAMDDFCRKLILDVDALVKQQHTGRQLACPHIPSFTPILQSSKVLLFPRIARSISRFSGLRMRIN